MLRPKSQTLWGHSGRGHSSVYTNRPPTNRLSALCSTYRDVRNVERWFLQWRCFNITKFHGMGKEKDEGFHHGELCQFQWKQWHSVNSNDETCDLWWLGVQVCFFSEMLCAVVRLLSVVKSWEHCAVWVDSVDLCSVCYENKRCTEKIFLPSCQTTFYNPVSSVLTKLLEVILIFLREDRVFVLLELCPLKIWFLLKVWQSEFWCSVKCLIWSLEFCWTCGINSPF